MSLRKNLGRRLRELRVKKGMTQEGLAEKTGLSVTFVGLVERGINTPSLETCNRIARALGVSIDELFYFQKDDKKLDLIKSIMFKIRKGTTEELSLINEVAERILEYSKQKKSSD